jgi:chromosome segregation ATPase
MNHQQLEYGQKIQQQYRDELTNKLTKQVESLSTLKDNVYLNGQTDKIRNKRENTLIEYRTRVNNCDQKINEQSKKLNKLNKRSNKPPSKIHDKLKQLSKQDKLILQSASKSGSVNKILSKSTKTLNPLAKTNPKLSKYTKTINPISKTNPKLYKSTKDNKNLTTIISGINNRNNQLKKDIKKLENINEDNIILAPPCIDALSIQDQIKLDATYDNDIDSDNEEQNYTTIDCVEQDHDSIQLF